MSCAVLLIDPIELHQLKLPDGPVQIPPTPLQVSEMEQMIDPCPLPSMLKRRGLNEKERLLYAPMADIGGLLYDKDAVYVTIPDWKVRSGLICNSCAFYIPGCYCNFDASFINLLYGKSELSCKLQPA